MNNIPRQSCIGVWWILDPLNKAFFTCIFYDEEDDKFKIQMNWDQVICPHSQKKKKL